MPIYADVNGVQTSYCSIGIGIAQVKVSKVKSINYKDAGEIPKIMGTSPIAVGRTRGKNESEGDIELYQEAWDEILPVLTAGGSMGYMETVWPVAVSYAEPTAPQKVKVDMLYSVRFHSAEKANAEGTDALTVRLQMSILAIAWHGQYMAMRPSFLR